MSDDLDKMQFELRRLPEYTEQEIIREIQRVAELIPRGAITVAAFQKIGRVDRNTIIRRFGNWGSALRAAGLEHRSSRNIRTKGATSTSHITDDEILNSLRRLAVALGKATLTVADLRNAGLPFSDGTLRRRWKTSQSAISAAGLGTSERWRRYTDQECFENLFAAWTHYGRAPQFREMSLPPSTVGGKAYVSRYGSWNKALAAFVEEVSKETKEQTVMPQILGENVRPNRDRVVSEVRDIRLGMRFHVLRRDNFKCVLCGAHPAANPTCQLHVDHILPWSKGGRTVVENLRTLCANCNVGRGNRYVD